MSIDLVLMLSAAAAGGLLAHAVRLPPMVGFLLAGFALAGLGVEGTPALEALADFGVVLLLFAIGLKFDIRVEGTLVCSGGYATREAAQFTGDEVEIEVTLPGDGAETEVFFSDFGHEYITINADYTT